MAKCVKWLHSQTERVGVELASTRLQPLSFHTLPVTIPESLLQKRFHSSSNHKNHLASAWLGECKPCVPAVFFMSDNTPLFLQWKNTAGCSFLYPMKNTALYLMYVHTEIDWLEYIHSAAGQFKECPLQFTTKISQAVLVLLLTYKEKSRNTHLITLFFNTWKDTNNYGER